MDKVSELSRDDRRDLFVQTARDLGFDPAVVEKDFWVCWVLKRLFQSPELSKQLVFKGGTSLSKVHHLIERFSEDIDLVLDWQLLGYGKGGDDPWATVRSNTQLDKSNREFNRKAADYIRETLCPQIERLTQTTAGIRCVIPDDEPQVIEIHYEASLQLSALRPNVKLEIGPLASWVPSIRSTVRPYAADAFPKLFDDPECPVVAITAERTFWEKATILHQQAHRTGRMPEGYSRHYYDLYCLGESRVRAAALADLKLLGDVRLFKQRFYRSKWASYETAMPGTFKLMPTKMGEANLQDDYAAMRPMFFSDPPKWPDILDGLKALEDEINAMGEGRTE